MTTFIILAAVLVGYFLFMKCYWPKFRQQYAAAEGEAEKEWAGKRPEILAEYFGNPDKFGLVAEAIEGDRVLGMISTQAPAESLLTKARKQLTDAVTFTRTVDMSHYYFVASERALRLLGFDGERCFLNEAYDYASVAGAKLTERSFVFEYRGEQVKIPLENGGAVAGYPRFAVHEFDKTATANDRTTNYFVREYFAVEPTGNLAYKQAKSLSFTGLSATKEQMVDYRVRAALVEGFKARLQLA